MKPSLRKFKQHYSWTLLVCALLCSCFSDKRLELGDKAPGFELKTLEGENFHFDPTSGKIHLIYFWAAWCSNCEKDFKLMDKLYKIWKKEPNGLCFLAINAGQKETRIRNFVKKMKTSFPIYIDHDAKLARSFGVHGLPTYFLTDKQGIIQHIILGWAEEKALLDEIAKIK